MDWLAEINTPLVVIRAIHFAATAVTSGALIFRAVVAEPVMGSKHPATMLVRSQILLTASVGLAIAAASGVIWLLLQALAMGGVGFQALTFDLLSTVLDETQFGAVSKVRFGLAVLLAACLALDRFAGARWPALGAALGLVAAIAWTGHAGSTPGALGELHQAADLLHLLAAAAWTGGLVSLALLLAAAGRSKVLAWASLARDAARRFSTLGILSVATLVITGLINAWILVGSFRGLLLTGYGRLLMVKIAVFAIMLTFAGINRLWLTPQLALAWQAEGSPKALARMTRNSIIEIALAFAVLAIVGVLGTLHPASHLM